MDTNKGLSTKAVQTKQLQYGYNEIPSQSKKNILTIVLSILKEPMIFLLLSGGCLYLFLGELKDAIALLFSVFMVIGITYYQERKTENALKALRDLSSPRALVIRNGVEVRIPGREVVVDDIIILQEGDRVPADATVISSQNLLIDESLLTGESIPVHKFAQSDETKPKEDGENSTQVFSGTLISQGSGRAKVTSIGISTKMGQIGKSLDTIVDEDSLLKREINEIVRIFGVVGIILCFALMSINFYLHGNILSAFLSGLTLSIAMLPEEFPLVLLIFLTLGAWRISKKHVLTRNNQAIETLGATTVLCVDKTGTLTQNHLVLASLVSQETADLTSTEVELPSKNIKLLKFAKLASKRHAFDPLEKEINTKYQQFIAKEIDPFKDWHLEKAYELSKDLMAVTRVWKSPKSSDYIVSCKGAPEAILKLCHLKASEESELLDKVKELSQKGQRVLGVAEAKYTKSEYPESPTEFDFTFLGFIGFVDPLRSQIHQSVQECYAAGIRVIMITGDYPGTAAYIAKEAMIKDSDQFVLGSDLAKMAQSELQQKIKKVNIFARILPEQKLQIVEALKANGEIVAMTGDGVNDGPALKSAHIGIAMGGRGTDVARESADLVLLDDDFNSIVSAVKLGRRIYDNLQKAVSYIFSIHIPIAGVAIIPTLFNLPTVLFPVHIAFMELIIDPASSTVYESQDSEKTIMDRPPRNLKSRLFGKSHVFVSFLHGLTLLAIVMAVFVYSISQGKSDDQARTMAFLTMVMSNLALILANLSSKSLIQKYQILHNRAFNIISLITITILTFILSIPFTRDLFHFATITFNDFLIILIATFSAYFWFEFLKLFRFIR